MEAQEFTQRALKTESRPETLNVSSVGLHALLSVAQNAAEVLDVMKKVIFYGKGVDGDRLFRAAITLNDAATFVRQCTDNGALLAGGADNPNLQLDAVNKRLLHAAFGMFTEAGEMMEALKTALETGEFDRTNFVEELGDSDWYKAIAHDEIGIPETATRAIVIAKLEKRYGEAFTEDAAENRDLEAERKILEEGTA